jgi:cellulose synthase/poly-beta-1,6-N-acetylglucosamine synthase-like glycosyltransferase
MPTWLAFLVLMFAGPLLILLLDSLLRAWFMLVSWRRPTTPRGTTMTPAPGKLAVVIPAHDEDSVIGSTVARLRAQIPARDLFVIADNCTDDTAAVARQAGAQVWERGLSHETGKGAALRWFLNTAAEELHAYEAIAIFDADSVVDDSFWHYARTALAQGVDVVQGFVQPLSGGSPAADLAAYSELLSQYVDDTARARLGWSAPLRGTGMVFRRQVLVDMLPHLQTKVEDIEMSLLLAAQGRSVVFVPEAIVGDPKPASARGVAAQRARWLQGQREVLQHHAGLVGRLLLSGRPAHISLVFANLLKPKTLVLFFKGLLLALAWLLPSRRARWFCAISASLALIVDSVYYIAGLRLVERPGYYARALAQAPIYLFTWFRSVIVSLVSASPWISARRDQ